MPPEVAKYSAIIGIVAVICSVTASYAVTRTGVVRNAELIADHEERLRTVETQVAQEISAMSADIEWIRYYMECIMENQIPEIVGR